ncbi:MAG: chromosomal replication initiator protein DnaA [Chloroflexi bacterium]|nr:MAG: chromosomal replication initiator protein DnaA [Chloroflexota bacterium]RLC89357.1 MAG: chromosomal replication initiator protein DnaA [Chloroflexota bacterium]
MKPEHIWSAALGELQLQMTQATFETWLRDSRLLKYEDGTFVIGVKSGYAKDWLEHRLLATIKRTLARLTGRTVAVRFIVWSKEVQQQEAIPLLDPPTSVSVSAVEERPLRPSTSANLNPRYTFDSFVVGPGNRLAHAASMAVTEHPAGAYNPLFIYGGVGLGKTHLLHAIGHECQAQGLRVLYVSSEKFTNDLIEAIRSHTTDAFREKYRTTDVLLVDDIQFIAGKESTQEEFFHTFNALHGTGKQIVISSDRAPKAMVTLEERLCSRFEWGLIADIQPPDLETRIAILRSKSAICGAAIPDETLVLIATRIQSNIRELEGALNRVLAMSRLTHQPLTPEVAETALSTLLPQRSKLTPDQIVEIVAQHFGVAVPALQGRSRSRAIARPRQIAMYLIREETGASLPQIGAILGGRDHTTVLYGCERIADLIEEDADLRREIIALRQRLYNNGE